MMCKRVRKAFIIFVLASALPSVASSKGIGHTNVLTLTRSVVGIPPQEATTTKRVEEIETRLKLALERIAELEKVIASTKTTMRPSYPTWNSQGLTWTFIEGEFTREEANDVCAGWEFGKVPDFLTLKQEGLFARKDSSGKVNQLVGGATVWSSSNDPHVIYTHTGSGGSRFNVTTTKGKGWDFRSGKEVSLIIDVANTNAPWMKIYNHDDMQIESAAVVCVREKNKGTSYR